MPREIVIYAGKDYKWDFGGKDRDGPLELQITPECAARLRTIFGGTPVEMLPEQGEPERITVRSRPV
jgi:hypothetical protein